MGKKKEVAPPPAKGAKMCVSIIYGTQAVKPKEGTFEYYPAYRGTNKQDVILGTNLPGAFFPNLKTGFIKEVPPKIQPDVFAVDCVKEITRGIFIPLPGMIAGMEHRGVTIHEDLETGQKVQLYHYVVIVSKLTRDRKKYWGGEKWIKGQPDEFLCLKEGPRPWRGKYSDTLTESLRQNYGIDEINAYSIPDVPYVCCPADMRIILPALMEGNSFVTGEFKTRYEILVSSKMDLQFMADFKSLYAGDAPNN